MKVSFFFETLLFKSSLLGHRQVFDRFEGQFTERMPEFMVLVELCENGGTMRGDEFARA